MDAFTNQAGFKKVVKIIAGFVLALNVITGITVICLVNKKHPGSTPSPKQRMQELKQSLDDVYNVYKETGQAVSKTSDTHSTNQDGERPSVEFLSLLKPVTHLSGLDFAQKEKGNTEGNKTLRNWAVFEGSERNLMYNGVTYENGSFVIPVTGTYFVYSHVQLYVEDNKKASDQRNVFYHKLLRYSALDMTEDTILSNQVTECKEGINDGARLEYPSDIQGVVLLNAWNQLKVKVSNFSLLNHDRSGNWHYMGVYLL